MLYLVCVQVDLGEQKVLQFIDQKVAVSGIVSQDIIKKNGTYRITISNISFNYSKNTLKSQVYAMLSDVPEDVSRSDIVVLEGILKSGFGDYVGFLYRPKIVSYGKPSPPDYAEQARSTFSSALRSTINDDKKSNLALGYLVGEKGKMTEDFTDSLRRIGMTHAVASHHLPREKGSPTGKPFSLSEPQTTRQAQRSSSDGPLFPHERKESLFLVSSLCFC